MEGILELFFNFFITLWENAETILTPIIEIITNLGEYLITILGMLLEFFVNALEFIWEGIINIFEFFGIDITGGGTIDPGIGGGGHGGGGGSGR